MKALFFETHSGISGNMIVAALLDLGADFQKLKNVLESLRLEGLHFHLETKNSYSIAGKYFSVRYHGHSADDVHSHEEHYHEHAHHEHRHLKDVLEIISKAEMTPTAKNLACRIFNILAEAESKAHGVEVAQVHFHEVGAIDSIVDVISIAVLLDDLKINSFFMTPLSEGKGFVQTQHGLLPIPVPAVLNIAAAFRVPLKSTDTEGEMVTPTGIAALAALNPKTKLPESWFTARVGIGLGSRDFKRANFLRVSEIEYSNEATEESVYELHSNIDDASAEELGFAMQKIFDAGALDVSFIPLQMKKNRPATELQVLVKEPFLESVEYAILKSTSTIGIRKHKVERVCMEREILDVETPYGTAKVKRCVYKDIERFYPEYENILEMLNSEKAKQSGIVFRELFDEVKRLCKKIDGVL